MEHIHQHTPFIIINITDICIILWNAIANSDRLFQWSLKKTRYKYILSERNLGSNDIFNLLELKITRYAVITSSGFFWSTTLIFTIIINGLVAYISPIISTKTYFSSSRGLTNWKDFSETIKEWNVSIEGCGNVDHHRCSVLSTNNLIRGCWDWIYNDR